MNILYWLTKTLFKGYLVLFHRHKVYGLEHVPNGAAIIAPNHASYLDPPMMAVSFPDEIHFLARASLFTHFGLSTLIRNLNSYPVKGTAEDLSSIKLILKLLSENKKVVIFPEGFRTYDGSFSPIKSGIGMLALRGKCPVIPVYIHGTFNVWSRHVSFPRPWRGQTACVIGTPIQIESYLTNNKKETQEAISNAVADSISELKNWYDKGAKGNPP